MKEETREYLHSAKLYLGVIIGGLVGSVFGTAALSAGSPVSYLVAALIGAILGTVIAKPAGFLAGVVTGAVTSLFVGVFTILFGHQPFSVWMIVALLCGGLGGLIAWYVRYSHTMMNVFHSPRFVIGFTIISVIVLCAVFYPLFDVRDPNYIYGDGFLKPGTYFSVYDANIATFNSTTKHRIQNPNEEAIRHEKFLPQTEREVIIDYLARKYAYDLGYKIESDVYGDTLSAYGYAITDTEARTYGLSSGMARDLDKDLEIVVNKETEAIRVAQAEIDEFTIAMASSSNPRREETQIKNRQRKIAESQEKIATLQANRPTTILEADAVTMWKDEYRLTSEAQDRVALLELWNQNYTQIVAITETSTEEERAASGIPDGFKTGTGFLTQGLLIDSVDTGHYTRINRALRIDPTAKMSYDQGTKETGIAGQPVAITDYTGVNEVANVVNFPLGSDNFGHDMLLRLMSAIGKSLMIGLLAGSIATVLGLIFGLLAGYVGGMVDDILSFIMNIFTVIPGFVLMIIIYNLVNKDQRGVVMCGTIIGITSWVWTARSVRSQVISLRNRDHVNLSKLSGHSLVRIILTDILPYIASYVVMAFILQVSSGILAEAQLSILGLGPDEAKSGATLGLLMNWAKLYGAYTTKNAWWAYFPVIGTIAMISFSLNLMNTGLDQVFNPTLRD